MLVPRSAFSAGSRLKVSPPVAVQVQPVASGRQESEVTLTSSATMNTE